MPNDRQGDLVSRRVDPPSQDRRSLGYLVSLKPLAREGNYVSPPQVPNPSPAIASVPLSRCAARCRPRHLVLPDAFSPTSTGEACFATPMRPRADSRLAYCAASVASLSALPSWLSSRQALRLLSPSAGLVLAASRMASTAECAGAADKCCVPSTGR